MSFDALRIASVFFVFFVNAWCVPVFRLSVFCGLLCVLIVFCGFPCLWVVFGVLWSVMVFGVRLNRFLWFRLVLYMFGWFSYFLLAELDAIGRCSDLPRTLPSPHVPHTLRQKRTSLMKNIKHHK